MNRISATSRWVLSAVIALTVLGFALRLARYQQSLFGDETSTLYLIRGRSFGEVLSLVSSNKEITPPFYFLLAWLTSQLGSAAELIRLPSLIAGTAVIPLTYVVGFRMMGRIAGLIAAALVTLSPTLIFISGDGRAYAVAVLLLVGSTAAMLTAARGGRTPWWVAYGALSCLAVYSHYTAAFVLAGQLVWLLWAHPAARRPALLANVGAAIFFLPWVPWLIDDFNSPTVDILSALQGAGFAAKRYAVEVWAVGYPFRSPHDVPGVAAAIIGLGALVIAAAAAAARRRSAGFIATEEQRMFDRGLLLALALLISAPLFELLLLLAGGNDLFGARNLNVAWVGLAFTFAGAIVAAGRVWGSVALVALLACLTIGTGRALDEESRLPDTKLAASIVNERSRDGEVLIDLYTSPLVNPVPTSALSAYATGASLVSPFLPSAPPPFLLTPSQPEIDRSVKDALSGRSGGTVYVVGSPGRVTSSRGSVLVNVAPPALGAGGARPINVPAPPGSRIVRSQILPGVDELQVVEIRLPGRQG